MTAPKAKAKPKARPRSKPVTEEELIESVEARMQHMMQSYQEHMEAATKKYTELVEEAHDKMLEMTQAAQPKPKRQPQAIWHDEGGEKLLILNKEAADFFMNIFENLGLLTVELEKKLGSKKR